MKKILLNKKFIIIFSILTTILLVFSYIKEQAAPPLVIKTLPATNAKNVPYYDPVLVYFEDVVDATQISIVSEPIEEWSITQINNTTIRLDHKQYFRIKNKYLITINYQSKPIYTIDFETQTQQSDPRYVQEVNSEMERDYPLATKLPHETSVYKIVYDKPLSLVITPKNNLLTQDQILSQVKEWVISNGVDPSTHTYKVIAPTE